MNKEVHWSLRLEFESDGFCASVAPSFLVSQSLTLGLQKAQSRYYLQTFDPKVGTICILGALG